jgi:hypothetical protein
MTPRDTGTALAARQESYRDNPWRLRPYLLPAYQVRILIVLDGGDGFADGDFALGALLDALATPPQPWVRFAVTTARRDITDPTADLSNFRFDAHDLSGYDQIWLFGVARTDIPGFELSLTEPELRVLSQFMDDGGGVFATGDHEDLGVAMCGRVPRVRSMRKWHWPDPGPNGEPVAPNVDGVDRLDTLGAGNDPGVQFDDQSDDVPQRITPRMYSTNPWNPVFHRQYPHPLLCGPRGAIRVLPDHPHEGECYVPADLSATFTFDGYQVNEYPGGVAPEIVATSTIAGGRSETDVKGLLNAGTFGAIGAYDGHRVGIGRVVVDATWHHFFNINLVGELGNPDPVKGIGFAASGAGRAAYEEIRAYYRNIALWLARPASHEAMWWRALWWLRWDGRVAMDLRSRYLRDPSLLDGDELRRIGSEAREVLGGAAGRCVTVLWVGQHLLRPHRRKPWESFRAQLDPWLPRSARVAPTPRSLPGILRSMQGELLLDTVLGAAVYGVAHRFPTMTDDAAARATDVDWAAMVLPLVDQAMDITAAELDDTSVNLTDLRSGLAAD